MKIPPGTRFGRYEIRSPIGAGGMGEVYLAEDTQLDRTVALKVLPPDIASDQQRMQRFIQEAKAASALNHPNILTIYGIGEADSACFIATEFIDGITLRERVLKAPMPIGDVLEVGMQVASALSAAHEAGIVHRDIKPENIMLRPDGYIKVLDFGLAKLTEKAGARKQTDASTLLETDPGVVMGTIVYMSPEQARGMTVDGRSDVWSLGVVLYEMIAGRPPFGGETKSDVISLILQKEPPPLARFAPGVPAEMDRIVMKALAKDTEERYQGVKDLLIDLRRLKQRLDVDAEIERTGSGTGPVGTSGGQTVPASFQSAARTIEVSGPRPTSSAEYIVGELKQHKRWVVPVAAALLIAATALVYFFFMQSSRTAIDSIAVLPLVNANNDPNTDFLSDGITESLINSLSQIPELRVMARSTAFRYKGQELDPQKIGRELDVRAVLTGRVLQRGDTLTIQVDLVDTRDGSQLWGEQYNRKLSDILVVQQSISREVSEKLRLKLSGEQQEQLTKRYTDSTEAYELYLRGRYHWNKRTTDGLMKGIDYFQQAIKADPNYALAHAGLADSYNVLSTNGVRPPKEAFPLAKEAAEKALALDDTLAEAHSALAFIKTVYEWDWQGAEKEFKRAIALNPNYSNAHYFYAFAHLLSLGRMDEADAEMKRALALEPFSLIINTNLGRTYFLARQYDKAIEQYRKTLEMDASFPRAHERLQEAYEQKGMYAEAIADVEKINPEFGSRLRAAYEKSGVAGYWQTRIDLDRESQSAYVSAYFTAVKYASLGDKDRAFESLEKAYHERDTWLVHLKVDPMLDSLRSDPRYARLLTGMNLAP
ncbi:MAG TPA: protein kinase [Pyrinomonadaceae bacterium]